MTRNELIKISKTLGGLYKDIKYDDPLIQYPMDRSTVEQVFIKLFDTLLNKGYNVKLMDSFTAYINGQAVCCRGASFKIPTLFSEDALVHEIYFNITQNIINKGISTICLYTLLPKALIGFMDYFAHDEYALFYDIV